MQNDEQTTNQTVALTTDPVISWLEQIRDYIGSTPQSKDLAQRAIDRLRPPAIDPWAIVSAIVADLGTLRANDGGALISDQPNHPSASPDDASYYGGYLVAESVTRRNAIAFSFFPQLLVAAREHPDGRRILAQLAAALSAPVPARERVRDRLDGTYRLSRLAHEFQFAGGLLDEDDPFYLVSKMLERLAQGLLEGSVTSAAADIHAWLERRRDERHAARTGATS